MLVGGLLGRATQSLSSSWRSAEGTPNQSVENAGELMLGTYVHECVCLCVCLCLCPCVCLRVPECVTFEV